MPVYMSGHLSVVCPQPDNFRSPKNWRDEYMLGVCRQIYRISVSKGFEAR